jgi:hypothetical protein
MRMGGMGAAGVGVAVLGGGVARRLLSQSTETEARDDCFDDICAEDTEADFDKAKSQAKIANILFITGGVLAAAGVTLIVIGSTSSSSGETALLQSRRHHKPSPFSLKLTPMAQAGAGGVLAWGSF